MCTTTNDCPWLCTPLPVTAHVHHYQCLSVYTITCDCMCTPLLVTICVHHYQWLSVYTITCDRLCTPLPVTNCVHHYQWLYTITCDCPCTPLPVTVYTTTGDCVHHYRWLCTPLQVTAHVHYQWLPVYTTTGDQLCTPLPVTACWAKLPACVHHYQYTTTSDCPCTPLPVWPPVYSTKNSLWSTDPQKTHAIADSILSSTIWINASLSHADPLKRESQMITPGCVQVLFHLHK